MQWLNRIIDDLIKLHPKGELLLETGGSPSGTHHLGHMRELVIADAILLELRRKGRQAKLVYFVDDLDNLRKIPVDVPGDFEKYLGMPLCDVPAPDGSNQSYADYFLKSLVDGAKALGVDVEFIRSHKKYRSGFFTPAIERSLERLPAAKNALETLSGRKLGEEWSPIQINEEGYLKKRPFVAIDKKQQIIHYLDKEGQSRSISYAKGDVKLDWRLDWPARWWLQKVSLEPSGRDHMTKGSSYDTGVQIMRDVYEADPPYAVAYDFINLAGDNKKMSASKGTGLNAVEGSKIMPPEVVRYYILKAPPLKRLYFDPVYGVVQLMDEFAVFAAKTKKTSDEEQLWYVSTRGDNENRSVSRIPFSHLVASYQASLKDPDKTLEVIERTEHSIVAKEDAAIAKNELKFIDTWLEKRAPEEVKFSLLDEPDLSRLTDNQKDFLDKLADKISSATPNVDGEWFHKAIYELESELGPKERFQALYRVLIGKEAGPRAGWFLSILPRDWVIKRLRLEA